MTREKYLMKFTNRKTGDVWYSRHEKPDFVCELTNKQIKEIFVVEKITDAEEIKKNMWLRS